MQPGPLKKGALTIDAAKGTPEAIVNFSYHCFFAFCVERYQDAFFAVVGVLTKNAHSAAVKR